MILQAYLDQAIKKICPIHGISFGNLNDKDTWKIHYEENATPEQKDKAEQIINTFVWNDEMEKAQARKQRIEDNKSNLHMKAQYILWKKENPDKNFEDFIDYVEAIEI
jgi:hypothetical protein